MASAPNTTPSSAQQPDLRAFIVCEQLPTGLMAFPITTDHSEPHLRAGDVAIIDPDDCEPEHGELFLIEYGKGSAHPSMCLVETFLRAGRYGDGSERHPHRDTAWWTGAYSRPKTNDEVLRRLENGEGMGGGIFVDGPYGTSGAGYDYLVDKIVGRVVGILEPSFNEPKRLTGEIA